MKCCICGKVIEGHGHNPEPLEDGTKYKCCAECNCKHVIPARVIMFRRNKLLKHLEKVW